MNKLTLLTFLLLCIICIISAGCGAGSMEMRRSVTTGFDNEIDPFDFGDEFLHNTANYFESDTSANSDRNDSDAQTENGSLTSNDENVSQPEDSAQASVDNSAVNGFGYRVQIGTFNGRDNADKMAESARSETDYPVYVEYLSPFYRVRVGDFALKKDAEECVVFLKQKGFRDSRYVYTNINNQ